MINAPNFPNLPPETLKNLRKAADALAAMQLSNGVMVARAREAGASLRAIGEQAGISHEQARRLHARFQEIALDPKLVRQLQSLQKQFQDPAFEQAVASAAKAARSFRKAGLID